MVQTIIYSKRTCVTADEQIKDFCIYLRLWFFNLALVYRRKVIKCQHSQKQWRQT